MGFFRDKVIVNKSYNNTNTTITEKRAPTDESVRLLKEFEEKAESKFIDRIDVKTNIFEYTLFEFEKCLAHSGNKFMFYTIINGQDYKGEVTINPHKGDTRVDLLRAVHKDLTEQIVSKIVVESIENMDHSLFNTYRQSF